MQFPLTITHTQPFSTAFPVEMPSINEPNNKITMSLFTNDNDLKDQLAAAQAEVVEHESAIATREADIITITEQMAEVSEQLESTSAQLVTATETNVTLTSDLARVTDELAASMESQTEFDAKVAAAAAAQMAELGVKEPVAQIDEDSETDLYTQYTNLKASNPAAAGAFWRENEAAIKASV